MIFGRGPVTHGTVTTTCTYRPDGERVARLPGSPATSTTATSPRWPSSPTTRAPSPPPGTSL